VAGSYLKNEANHQNDLQKLMSAMSSFYQNMVEHLANTATLPHYGFIPTYLTGTVYAELGYSMYRTSVRVMENTSAKD